MRTGSIPRQNLVLEWIYAIRVSASVAMALVAFWLGLLIFIWLVEYLIYGVPFGEWLDVRWYIPLGILFLAVIEIVLSHRQRQEAWRQLEDKSPSAKEQPAAHAPGLYLTGNVSVSGVQVGLATVSLDATGMTIWTRGNRRAHIDWHQVQRIDAYEDSKHVRKARVLLKKDGYRAQVELYIPWDPAIEACEQAASLLVKRPVS